ncbi:hypothetical protein ACMU_03215 [Actibacterium mucosum KCTC 23349]|uniref:DUF1330 domain-containing protein n=1 Tax=Actibacterium mucosum KCTC 23349 TaxID=1454373 RepID=A0A037ZM72_9RHOB|nr:DUF1330 domain-containing protein [Actibacterium mucosum]KAJ57531.1 hypothetical protein ACMU_03215 [Actibacterium mucosum KCTC 23349]
MVYATVYLKITDPEAFDAYRGKAADALAKHGGSAVVSSKTPTMLDTGLEQPSVGVLLSFPTKEAALAWRQDPDLQEVHQLRNAAGQCSILLLD